MHDTNNLGSFGTFLQCILYVPSLVVGSESVHNGARDKEDGAGNPPQTRHFAATSIDLMVREQVGDANTLAWLIGVRRGEEASDKQALRTADTGRKRWRIDTSYARNKT